MKLYLLLSVALAAINNSNSFENKKPEEIREEIIFEARKPFGETVIITKQEHRLKQKFKAQTHKKTAMDRAAPAGSPISLLPTEAPTVSPTGETMAPTKHGHRVSNPRVL